MSGIRRGYLEAPQGQIHYRTASGGHGELLILLHDSPLNGFVYDKALPGLGEFCRPLALDTPGYGESDPPVAPLEIEGYAEAILDGVRTLGAERIHVLGTHTGASIGVEIARQSGDFVKTLILNGLPAYDDDTRRQKLSSWAPPMVLRDDGSHLVELWSKYVSLMPSASNELRQDTMAAIFRVWDRYNWAYNAAFRYQPLEHLGSLAANVTLMAAVGDSLASMTEAAAKQFKLPFHSVKGIDGRVPALATEQFVTIVRAAISPGTHHQEVQQ